MSIGGWLGLGLFGLGLAYRWRPLAHLDVALFHWLHRGLRGWSALWRGLWPLGTSVFFGLALVSVATRNTADALHAALAYLPLAILEPLIKRLLRRPRPFLYLGGVTMAQPRRPTDPSFPSGDALRVWFLALLLPAVFGLGPGGLLLACALAALVSLGRVALGVHHPLDVLAGAGLGLLGFALWTLF